MSGESVDAAHSVATIGVHPVLNLRNGFVFVEMSGPPPQSAEMVVLKRAAEGSPKGKPDAVELAMEGRFGPPGGLK